MRKPSLKRPIARCLLWAGVLSAVVVPGRAQPLAGADSCGADVNTAPSTIDFGTQGNRIRDAIRCLINAERTKSGLPELAVNGNLASAADGHAQRAGIRRWWRESNPHIDPDLDSDLTGTEEDRRDKAIARRINRAGYCPTGATRVSEIAKDGAGTNATECPPFPGRCSTPLSAVHWWIFISNGGHREAILHPVIREIGVGVIGKVANNDAQQNAQREQGAYVVNFGGCASMPPPVTTPPGPGGQGRPSVSVQFTNMHINDCPEIGRCDWKLACGLGNQPLTEFFNHTEAQTDADREINRPLTQDGKLPVTVTCTVHERDGPFLFFDDPVWEHVGTATRTFTVAVTDPNDPGIRINQDPSEGDVTVKVKVEQLGSATGPLTPQPSPPPLAPTGCRVPTEGVCGGISINCNAPLPVADNIFVSGGGSVQIFVDRIVSEIGLISGHYINEGDRVLAVCSSNEGGFRCSNGFAAKFGPSSCPLEPLPPRPCPEGLRPCLGLCISFGEPCNLPK